MAKYAVTFKYLVEPSKSWTPTSNLGRKNFASKKEAEDWAKSQAKSGKIQPLKLIDCSDINCPTTVKEYKIKASKPKMLSKPKTTDKPKVAAKAKAPSKPKATKATPKATKKKTTPKKTTAKAPAKGKAKKKK